MLITNRTLEHCSYPWICLRAPPTKMKLTGGKGEKHLFETLDFPLGKQRSPTQQMMRPRNAEHSHQIPPDQCRSPWNCNIPIGDWGILSSKQPPMHYPIFRRAHVLAALKKITLERWTGSKGKQGEQVQACASYQQWQRSSNGSKRCRKKNILLLKWFQRFQPSE